MVKHTLSRTQALFQASAGTVFRSRGLGCRRQQAGLDQILFGCLNSLAHCARRSSPRQSGWLCTTVNDFGNVGKLFAQKRGTMFRASCREVYFSTLAGVAFSLKSKARPENSPVAGDARDSAMGTRYDRYDQDRRYDSFSTVTLICAVTSRNTLMVTCDSPMIRMGSASCTWRLSILNPCTASPSAMSAAVTEPNI